jgi:hypothetical protein
MKRQSSLYVRHDISQPHTGTRTSRYVGGGYRNCARQRPRAPIVATLGAGLVCDTYASRPSLIEIEMHLDSISWAEAVRNGWLFG